VFDMPSLAPGKAGWMDRREALRLLALGAGSALTACSPPDRPGRHYVSDPETHDPGAIERFAVTLQLSGYGRGALAMVRDGRPIKIDGNPDHPASMGATDAFMEAAVLDLFDPQRSQFPKDIRGPTSWDAVEAALRQRLATESKTGGAGLRLLTGRLTSPTALRQIRQAQKRLPNMRWHRYEPLHDDDAIAGARRAWGRPVQVIARLEEAHVIVSLGCDFLGPGPDQIRLARGFASRRTNGPPSRLFVFEASPSQTGVCSDHRTALAPDMIRNVALRLAGALGGNVATPPLPANAQRLANAAATDLLASKGAAIVLVGAGQPADVHALCAWINARLSAPVTLIEPPDPHEDLHGPSLTSLADDLQGGKVSTLIVAGCNPAYAAPGALDMGAAIKRAGFVFHAGLYADETSALAQLHAPLAHALEAWSDARAPTGEASIGQPVVHPLFGGRSLHQILAWLADEANGDHAPVEATWREMWGGDARRRWRDALATGVIGGSAPAPLALSAPSLPEVAPARASDAITATLIPSASVWDGEMAPNAWLQECPEPLTKETWGASLRMAQEDMQRFGFSDGDEVLIANGAGQALAAARTTPFQAPGVITLPTGYGRRRSGPIADGVGADIFTLRDAGSSYQLADVSLHRTGRKVLVPSTQHAFDLEAELEKLFPLARPRVINGVVNSAVSGADEPPGDGLIVPEIGTERAWAMVIDDAACIGCNACVVACQAENNLPIVGPDEMRRQRDMHWMRIDYYERPDESGGFQPTPCMQCEQAPCEPVCPVEASVHNSQGINVQVYNRCIGTRFCQSNCPYKVRRFNYHDYAENRIYRPLDPAPLEALRNPDVTVRTRGVMEKCNYCLQRLETARHRADITDRPIADGEVKTACQAACPTQAIHFGDKADPVSDVAKLQGHARRYALLDHLGTRPRTTYLARIWNPSEDAPPQPAQASASSGEAAR
jgi:molybdopterin-containing oxidoreductase family iron-sulfur binding subunit